MEEHSSSPSPEALPRSHRFREIIRQLALRPSSPPLRHLLACFVHEDSSEDLKTKSKRALKAILAKCTHLQALQPLLREAPTKVQKYVLKQFATILPHDVEARRAFVQNGGLQFLQELDETSSGKLTEFIQQINACYPAEIVEYYSPHYSKKLLEKIDDFAPATN